MIRLFEQHNIRKQRELDGIWSFITEEGAEYRIPVPGCWEQKPELLNYRGKGTYTRKVYIQEKTNIRLELKGVSHTADVYFDDEFIVHHYNAFTAFCGIIMNVEPGEHVIRVEVDNSFSEKSSLHVPNDYYTYGGFNRTVVLEEIKDVYLKNIHFEPHKDKDGWKAKISIDVENLSDEEKNAEVTITLADKIFHMNGLLEGKSIAILELVESFENVREWFVLKPELYLLKAELKCDGVVMDDLTDRVGFREVEVKGRRLLLNGKSVFLKGFNRHEDYGTLGSAVPFQVMMQDLDMMREMGANAVRTCHYPNDERFLDLCDEKGMLVWEENHARGFNLEKMMNPHFDEQCRDCIDEMIYQHFNHPSIVIWGILNECASETEEGRQKYKMQYEQIKSLDTSRPTTSATCRHFKDICLDLPDIVSFNMYSGWYEDISVKEKHEKEMAWIDAAVEKEKPVIVSEFGAAAIYGFRDRGHCKWSEERQADVIRENLEVYKEDNRLTGTFIWQFADCKVTEEEWFSTRARCHNNKGVVDEYRRPKEAYDVVKEYFNQMPEGYDEL